MQKLIAVLALAWFSTLSAAMACPDVSGIYQLTDKLLVKYEQIECKTLAHTLGKISDDGTPAFVSKPRIYQMDGTPACNQFNKCVSVTSDAGTVKFISNFDGQVLTEEHGLCGQNAYSMSTTANGDLQTVFQVKRCQDGYAGPATKIFHKY